MSTVSHQCHGTVSVITVDSPPVNALSRAVRQGLLDCASEADRHPDSTAIVLICAGRTFIAGADIAEFDLPPEPPHLPEVVRHLEDLGKPIVAAVHGTALGGGLEIAMGCHYRLATASAKLGLPEVKLGLLPGAGGTQRLPRLVGVERALDIMLTGEPLAASDACDAGLVDEVVGDDELLQCAIAYAATQAAGGPRRVRELPVDSPGPEVFDAARNKIAARTRGLISPPMIIRSVELATQETFADAARAEREMFLECRQSPQARGLRHAFFAERKASKVRGLDPATKPRTLKNVAVLGAGTMGAGIAYNCLVSGYGVHLLDNDPDALLRGGKTIRTLFEGGVLRGKISDTEANRCLESLTTGTAYEDLATADLIVEAVVENMDVKRQVFAKLDAACKPGAILATNTSTLDIDTIAATTSRPQDVVGLHFFSPAHVMRLLEIVRGLSTAIEVVATALGFAKRLGKIGVVVGNCPGFVGNRMLYCYGRETQLLLLEGAAPEYVDQVMHDWGMAMGPNAVGDLSGLDVGYKGRRERRDLPDDPRYYRIADLLVEQGRLGQKTGKGMFCYDAGSRTPLPDPSVTAMIRAEAQRLGISQRAIDEQEVIGRCMYALVTEGCRIIRQGIAERPSDIDVIWINGYGFPRHRGGPMHFADSIGLDEVLRTVRQYCERFGSLYWEPPELLVDLVAQGRTFASLNDR